MSAPVRRGTFGHTVGLTFITMTLGKPDPRLPPVSLRVVMASSTILVPSLPNPSWPQWRVFLKSSGLTGPGYASVSLSYMLPSR